MDNSINFKGAFWIKQPKTSVKQSIIQKLGKSPMIFSDFTKEGDILLITSKSADKNVAKILVRHPKTKFNYYQDLNTKSGFNKNYPEKALNILLDYKKKVYTNISELKRIFKIQKSGFNFSIRKKDNTMEKCMKTLDLDFKDYDIIKRDGFNEVYTKDADKKLVAIISEPGQGGFRYARLEPQKPGDTVKRYAVLPGEKFVYVNNPDNKIEDATTDFLKNFIKSKKANMITHNAAHQ